MTGAWTTQAIAVAAGLGLADQIARDGGATSERLATLTGTDHDSLRRLLRYLASLGIVRGAGDSVRLTDLGELLRTDVEHSLHPLALLYGGSFYESFGRLMYAVRTGREAFEHHFGKNHFDYFAERADLADLFDRAMASSASMFTGVTEVVDFAGVDVVVYILSRVLHDWDDQQCGAILKRCAEAMPDHADLLIIERLLPENDARSLAVAWDLHMMCNVGGRERTATHYANLLAEAGFRVTAQHDLPLDAAILRASRAS